MKNDNAVATFLGAILIGFLIGVTIAFIMSFIYWWAWNTFMPAVFHLPRIGMWQAFALSLLISPLKASYESKKK